MSRCSRVLWWTLSNLICHALAGILPNVTLSDDRKLLSVSFVHGSNICNYELIATSVFGTDATIIVHTDHGAEQQAPHVSRTFVSRKQGMWATAVLDGDLHSSRIKVSGLFLCGGLLFDIPTLAHSSSMDGAKLKPVFEPLEMLNHSGYAPSRRLRGGRRLAGTTIEQGKWEIADETDDWKVPDAVDEDSLAATTWTGQSWFPGCYTGDAMPHVFKIALVADVAAVEKHRGNLNALIESTVARTSFIYESQMNIRLEVSDLQIYASANSAPNYASHTRSTNNGCPDIYDMLDLLTAGYSGSVGAVHLLTGCGEGYGIVGLAYVGAICGSHKTGVNQLHSSMSWVTFAHELGHNFGGGHSFEEGQGSTGGIMDYGDGKLNGEYQFNTQYRKTEMCAKMNQKVNRCNGNFIPDAQTPVPTPPATPAPAPPSSGCNDLKRLCPAYKAQGLCTKLGNMASWMAANCKKSCNLCDGSPVPTPPATPAPAPPSSGCNDLKRLCPAYKAQGLCTKLGNMASWMAANCKKSCNLCDGYLLSRSWLSRPCLSTIAILVALQFMSRH